MRSLLLTASVVALCGLALTAADAPKDTPAAAATRKKLKAKIDVEFKEEKMSDVVATLKEKIKDASGQDISIQIDNVGGVTNNLTVTYKGKGTVEEVLDAMFTPRDLGYIVVNKEYKTYKGGRYDGWLLIVKGKERGFAEGSEPAKDEPKDKAAKDKAEKDKAATKDKTAAKDKDKTEAKDKDKAAAKDKPATEDGDKVEMAAASKLKLCKKLVDGKQVDKAISRLKELIKEYPNTKAAEEAKKLLEKLK